MQRDEHRYFRMSENQQSVGASDLAESAVSVLRKRQSSSTTGARQFIVDHVLRAVMFGGRFDPSEIIDELRGHRLSVDAIIDVYVPAVARLLGEMWVNDEIDFATVTIGSIRLQSVLSLAASESVEHLRTSDNAPFLLVVVPLGEQHSLGAFVLAAQLRRMGTRVEVSFNEPDRVFTSRVICDAPDAILFSVSGRATLETVRQSVLNLQRAQNDLPPICLGGSLVPKMEADEDVKGIDLIADDARTVLQHLADQRQAKPDMANR